MYNVKILPSAKLDIKKSAIWYNDKQKGLGKKFTKQIREKIKFIKKNPKAISIRYDETTRAACLVRHGRRPFINRKVCVCPDKHNDSH